MTTLLLVRHAQTAWNNQARYQGHSDVPLGPHGLSQAERLARRLASCNVQAVYSSDLKRCLQTAQAIAAPQTVPVQPDAALRELNFGELEGKRVEDTLHQYPELYARWHAGDISACAPGGESPAGLAARLQAFLEGLDLREGADRQIVLVSHGGPLRILLCLLLGISPSHWLSFYLEPASLSALITREGRAGAAVVTLLNDTCHLREQ